MVETSHSWAGQPRCARAARMQLTASMALLQLSGVKSHLRMYLESHPQSFQ